MSTRLLKIKRNDTIISVAKMGFLRPMLFIFKFNWCFALTIKIPRRNTLLTTVEIPTPIIAYS